MAGGKLTALKARALTKPGRYGDGAGLWLQVRDADHRSWLLRYKIGDHARSMGLGPFPDVSLLEAREAAAAARRLLREGSDPIEARRARRATVRPAVKTFAQVAESYLVAHEAAWSSAKHRYQWSATLATAAKGFGDIPVSAIGTLDVLRVLEPLWRARTQTASRLRGRIEQLLDYAKVHGWRDGENPARWRGHLAKMLPKPGKIAMVKHHPALPWQEIGAFMASLCEQEGAAALALRFVILTACRSGEALGATWGEIDPGAAIWAIPAPRMKARREHRVPLSEAALDVLRAVAPLRDDRAGGWLFPGKQSGKPLSSMSMIMLLRRMGRGDLTVHGFRSSFRDWVAEATNYPREIAEQALAHSLTDRVEAAYRRGDLMEKRRALMADWATFCAGAAAGKGVPILA